MPKATVNPETHRFELKTLPESQPGADDGGFVVLRTLSFHEMQSRMDIATRMYQEQKVSQARKQVRGSTPTEDEVVRGYMEVMNVSITEFEFRNCIVDHNLFIDDAETQKIDFSKPMHTWKLDPKVGEEISKYIGQLTQMEDTDLVPLPTALSSSSLDETQNDVKPSLVET